MATLNPFKIYENFTKASDTRSVAPRILANIEGRHAQQAENTRLALRRLGKAKRDCFKADGVYERLYALLLSFTLPDDLHVRVNGKEQTLPALVRSKKCQEACDIATEIAAGTFTGAVAGATSGALVSFGVYSIVGTFFSAGTGTAISSLSGVAAMNATLAWLGGGTLAAGGLGMAGGVAALTGLAAVPALLVLGISLGAKSEKLLAQSEAVWAEVREAEARTNIVIEKARQVEEVAQLARRVLERLCQMAEATAHKLSEAPARNYKELSSEQQGECYKGYRLCDLINRFASIEIAGDHDDPCSDICGSLESLDASINTLCQEG